MKRTLHVSVEDRTRMLASIRASELDLTISEYVTALILKDSDESGLRGYLARKTREEACGE